MTVMDAYDVYTDFAITAGHVIGGKQSANDPDHPIAASHKGQ